METVTVLLEYIGNISYQDTARHHATAIFRHEYATYVYLNNCHTPQCKVLQYCTNNCLLQCTHITDNAWVERHPAEKSRLSVACYSENSPCLYPNIMTISQLNITQQKTIALDSTIRKTPCSWNPVHLQNHYPIKR